MLVAGHGVTAFQTGDFVTLERWLGAFEVEDFELPEGAEVTVYLHDGEGDEELTPEQEAEIEESIAELERGEGVPFDEVLQEVREILYGPPRS